MTRILATMFSWPNGIVVGNLIASALWAAPALTHLHRKINRHHREAMTRTHPARKDSA